MLAIVCKTYEGVKALEKYDREGMIDKNAGLHGLGPSIGRLLNGRFLRQTAALRSSLQPHVLKKLVNSALPQASQAKSFLTSFISKVRVPHHTS